MADQDRVTEEAREMLRELEHKGLVKKTGKFVGGQPVYVATCEAAHELERLGVTRKKCPDFDADPPKD